jgi:hypothetical protein
MIFLIYHTKNMSRESQLFEPFGILGLEPGASDSEIKKAYRRLSIQYHPDKNPDPGRNASWSSSLIIVYFLPFDTLLCVLSIAYLCIVMVQRPINILWSP